MKYHHTGIPTKTRKKGEIYLKDYDVYFTDHESNPYSIQWMRYGDNCILPQLVQEVAHVAFEVENVEDAIKGKKVIIKPNCPYEGVTVAFIEENGFPVEFIQFS